MRLTLRTLLAYLDDILEPQDAEELAAKIRESDFAGGLIHRIRNAVGRLRLSSPQVLGKGLGADANTVAEYLDNTLPSERVPDFEKVCLESDMMLSEVAASHEILTIVLGEHASVEPSLRRRIYELSSDSAETEVIGQSLEKGREQIYRRIDDGIVNQIADTRSAGDATQQGARTAAPVVAERAPGGGRTWITVLCAAAVIAAVALWLQRINAPVPVAQNASAPLTTAVPLEVEVVDVPTRREPDPQQDSGIPHPEPSIPLTETAPALADSTPLATPPRDDDSSIYQQPVAPDATGAGVETAVESVITAPDLIAMNPPLSTDHANDSVVENPAEVPSSDSATEPAEDVTMARDVPPPPEPGIRPTEAATLRMLPEGTVVATWLSNEEAWWRVPDLSAVPIGQPLFVLPEFTPRIVTQGLDVSLLGPTEWTVGEDDGRWRIKRGRFTISNLQEQTNALPIAIGSRHVDLLCAAPGTIAILDVRERTPLGMDPIEADRRLVVRLWVANGTVRLAENGGGSFEIQTGERWGFVGESPSDVAPELLPELMATAPVRDIDRQAREQLAPQLATDEPLVAALRSAYRDRRTDVRSLAARGLASLGIFEPLVETFNDPKFHASWAPHFDCLRSGVQRSAESAQAIRQALQAAGGPNADLLYQMLWGYPPEQLETGAAAELVNVLEHRDLPVRVFAAQSLRTITQATAGYRPDYHLNRRRDAIQIWRRKLDSGAIRYLIEPENDLAW